MNRSGSKDAVRAPTEKCVRVLVEKKKNTLDTAGVVRDSALTSHCRSMRCQCDTCTMHKVQKSAAVKLVVIVLVVAMGIVLILSRRDRELLGEAPPLDFSSPDASKLELPKFLGSDFAIIKDVRLLPRPVLEKFT